MEAIITYIEITQLTRMGRTGLAKKIITVIRDISLRISDFELHMHSTDLFR